MPPVRVSTPMRPGLNIASGASKRSRPILMTRLQFTHNKKGKSYQIQK
jgi:hypothetical protein